MEILDVVFITITLVALVALALWIGRKIRSGNDYTPADNATEVARGHAAAYNNHQGGLGGL